MKKIIFKGAGVAIVTPFNADGSINFAVFAQLIEFQITNGTDAIVVCGTTGESATMSNTEQAQCIEFASERPCTGHRRRRHQLHRTRRGIGQNSCFLGRRRPPERNTVL